MMEEIVEKRLAEVLEGVDCCKCEKCRLDMISYALNRLPAKYAVTIQGETLSYLEVMDKQFTTDVLAVITQAVELVRQNPHH